MSDFVIQPPFEAYRGNESYIFVSYAHKDGTIVFPEIKYLHNQDCRIWYDEGIDPGNEWPEEVAIALANASLFVVFISPNSVDSQNVRNEINFALNKRKPFIAVHIKETKLPHGLELRMGDIQAIFKYRMNQEAYSKRILRALGIYLGEQGNDNYNGATPAAFQQSDSSEYEPPQGAEASEAVDSNEGRLKLTSSAHHLRSTKISATKKNYKKIFRLTNEDKPISYIKNEFEDSGDGTVIDRATGLMWEASSPGKDLTYKEATEYIKQLNKKHYAGYIGWRIPTIEELKSLLEPKQQFNEPCINPIFKLRNICWSTDFILFSNEVWGVHFLNGIVYWFNKKYSYEVRAVRSLF